MLPKVKTTICTESVDFFRGTASEVIEKIRAIQDEQPAGVLVEIDLAYYGYDGGADIVFNAVRDMNEEEKSAHMLKEEKEKAEKSEKKKNARVKKILAQKQKGEIVSDADQKFIAEYLKG